MIAGADSEGIYMATLEMLEHSLGEADLDRRLAAIDAGDLDQARKLMPKHEYSPGYADCVLYLFWLRDRMNAGIVFENISADEADGVAAVQRAVSKFNSEHPPCPGCGQRLTFRGQKHCFGCHRELN